MNGSRSWAPLVALIHVDVQSGMGELHSAFAGGLRGFLARRVGPDDVEDLLHDTLIDAVLAIQRGDLRDPERLGAFLRGIAWRKVAALGERRKRLRRPTDGDLVDRHCSGSCMEAEVLRRERYRLAREVMELLSERDREVLRRFYFDAEPAERIQAAMRLTSTQFRLLKWRAKARLRDRLRRDLDSMAPEAA